VWKRILEGSITLALWLGYLYLMRHALSVVLSYFGISAPWGLQWSDVSVPPLVTNIRTYALVVLVNGAVFISWALYNKYMFGYRGRRRSSAAVTPAEMSAHFLLTEAQVEMCRTAKRIVMVHDQSGKLIQYDAF
jgi:poly-beta-1,6-N-acetyl-D-glucosamine biosynthesis protein PgaD